MMTPIGGQGGVPLSVPYWQRDINDRNRYYTDEELDQILPSQGYEVSLTFNSLIITRFFIYYLQT